MHEDIRRHETRVCQQAGVDVIRLFAHFLLERSHALEFAQIRVHIQIEIKLEHLLYVGLYVNRRFLGIDTASEIFAEDGLDRFLDISRRRMRRQRMPIGNEEHAVILVLHLHKTLHGTKIVAEVQIARGAYTTNNSFHIKSQSVTGDK